MKAELRPVMAVGVSMTVLVDPLPVSSMASASAPEAGGG